MKIKKIKKSKGTTGQWTIFRNDMLTKCQSAITGLPKWAKEITDVNSKDNDIEIDDYDQELNDADLWGDHDE